MSVTTTCRDLSELSDNAELACRLLFQEAYKAGIKNIFITETYRSQARQNYLYEQGRTRKGQVVTWTKSSRHTSRLAWDIAVGSPNSLYDVNILNKVGAIAMKLGITWGGQPSWVKAGATDRPHFEVAKNWSIPKGYKLEGKVTVPSNSKMKVQLVVDDKKNTIPVDKGITVKAIDTEVKDMKFTSNTLKERLDFRLRSPETELLLAEYAVKELKYQNKWVEQAKNGKLADGDLLAIAIELAVELAKQKRDKK